MTLPQKEKMFRKILTKYELEEGGFILKGYGVAYWNIAEAKAILYPIPLNILVNLHRKIVELITFPNPPKLNKLIHTSYMKGRADGIRLMQKRMQDTYDEIRKERGWR